MIINVPGNINKIIEDLQHYGFEAFIVGGCVRDSLLGRAPKDWDICTSASPDEIKKVFAAYRTIDIGIEHGTVAVMYQGEKIEITTYRIDGEYLDNRRPSSVAFTKSLKEDLIRRDFTINAMAYNTQQGLIDYFEGIKALKNKSIIAVGDPLKRFSEDALRIMRGIRFTAELGFCLEDNTLKAMKEKAPLLKHVSAERIRVEMDKMLMSSAPEMGLRIFFDTDVMEVIFPVLKTEQISRDTAEKYIEKMKCCSYDLCERITLLLKIIEANGFIPSESGKYLDMLQTYLYGLKYDRNTIKNVTAIYKYSNIKLKCDKIALKKQLMDCGMDILKACIDLKKTMGTLEADYDKLVSLLLDVEASNEPYTIKSLSINGDDLIRQGIPKGRTFGIILNNLMERVIEEPGLNNYDELSAMAEKIYDEIKKGLLQ